MFEFTPADISALLQVILIDLALAGDNAVAVGLAASGLAPAQRRSAIIWGTVGALVLRVIFALITVQLLNITGILLVGGLLLLWVALRMWIDLKKHQGHIEANTTPPPTSFSRALFTIIIADVSMSLDNVLAVAGVSRHNPAIMAFGLVLSVILMAVAASWIAKLIHKFQWLAFIGIAIIVFAGIQMIWEDLSHFFPDYIPPMPSLLGDSEPAPAH